MVLISLGGGGGGGGGEKLDFFTPWGGSFTVTWGRLGGKFIGLGGGTSPAPPTPLD